MSVVGARLTSAGVNFTVNRRLVFDATHTRGAAARYALLAATLLALNYLLLSGLTGLGVALLPAKVLTELALVSTSFAAQRHFVFRPRGRLSGRLTGDAQDRPTSVTGGPSSINVTSR